MSLTAQLSSYNAKQFDASQKQQLALKSLSTKRTVTELAQQNKVSRKFIHQQKTKALNAVNDAFEPAPLEKEKVLFYLPVTFTWLCQLILCLILHCRANHRGVQKLLLDAFDHEISLGSIHSIVDRAKTKAKALNAKQDVSGIKLAALDEMFHHNKPVLTGIDIRSLYCFLLSDEHYRDFDTWGTHFLDLQKQGLKPERFLGDDADGIRSAQKFVYPNVPYDLDNFHIIRDMIKMRRFFRNRLKSAITACETLQEKVDNNTLTKNNQTFHAPLEDAQRHKKKTKTLSQSIDTLVNWMQHDVLNMPGLEPTLRYELYDFIVTEFQKLAKLHPHRIQCVCTSLKNQRPFLLAFTQVLNEKFQTIADELVFPLEKIWELCQLQRCKHSSDNYAIRSLPLQDYFGVEFDEVEDAVLNALDSTERTSSMVENLHSRLRPYFSLRQEIGFDYLELLRFYLNHTPFLRSAREERQGKTPTQILTGKSHPHWLEMLEFQRFKKAA